MSATCSSESREESQQAKIRRRRSSSRAGLLIAVRRRANPRARDIFPRRRKVSRGLILKRQSSETSVGGGPCARCVSEPSRSSPRASPRQVGSRQSSSRDSVLRRTTREERTMDLPRVVSRAEWLVARRDLLATEKEATRRRDALSAARRKLPMVEIEKEYTFEGPDGRQTLRELFRRHRQLIVYHFMFDPSWDE